MKYICLNLFASILLSFVVILLNKQALNHLLYQARQHSSRWAAAVSISSSTAAQQQLGSSYRYQQQHDSSCVPRQHQGRCAKEYARVQIRARQPTMASGDFWQTCLANCWRGFFFIDLPKSMEWQVI